MVLIIETIVKVLKACVSPMALFILSLTILFVYIFKAGTNYLNIKKIFKDYISIFSDARKHLWLFWGVPVLLSTALVQVTVLTSELAEHLSVFLSILISAFFAMLSILVSKDISKQTGKLYEQVLKETASTVLLEISLLGSHSNVHIYFLIWCSHPLCSSALISSFEQNKFRQRDEY